MITRAPANVNVKETGALRGSQVNNPDPPYGCAKSFAAEWQCGGTAHAG